MAENGSVDPQAGAQPQAQPQVKMQVLGQYIRDMSFENILSQKGVQGEVAPEISVQVNLDAKKRPTENQYEVILKFNISSKNKGTDVALFVLELEYGGIFLIENVPEAQLHPFLLIECPRMIFPFARQILADATRNGGFPPLMLDPIDFASMYQKRQAEAQAQAQAPQSGPIV